MSSGEHIQRYTVRVSTIDPVVPDGCVGCGTRDTPIRRRLVFRRSDGAVERVSAVHWPYCEPCHKGLAALDRTQRTMTLLGLGQMLIVFYAVGGAMGWYDFWYSSLAVLAALFVAFVRTARKARALWDLEHARIDDVYKGGIGAAYSFRSRAYAERFAAANAAPASDAGSGGDSGSGGGGARGGDGSHDGGAQSGEGLRGAQGETPRRAVGSGNAVAFGSSGALAAACSVACCMLLACGTSGGGASCDAAAREAYPEGPHGVQVGDTIEDLSFTTIEGESLSLGDVRGDPEVTLLYIVTAAGWCTACIEEQDTLESWHQTYGPQGLAIVQPIFEDASGQPATAQLAERWIDQYGVTFTVVVDAPNVLLPYYPNGDTGAAPLNLILDPCTMEILRLSLGADPSAIEAVIQARL